MSQLPPPEPTLPPAAARPARPRYRLVAGLVAVVVLLAGGWSLYWWQAAETLERAISEAGKTPAEGGRAELVCRDRVISGYPFHLVLTCSEGVIAAPGLPQISLGAITASARLDNPQAVTADITGPLEAGEAGAPLLSAAWQHGRLSLHFSGTGLRQGAITIDKPGVTALGLPLITADLVELVVGQEEGAGASTAALTITGGHGEPGTPPLDVSLIVAVDDNGRTLAGQGLQVPPQGLPLKLTRLSLRSGPAAIEAEGDLSLRPDGLLDGSLDVRLVDPKALAGVIGGLAPGLQGLGDPIATAVAMLGQPTQVGGRPASGLTVALRASRAFIGFIPVGRLPPIPVGP
ncbi:DUF2125 domain-containing protein [Pseudoxanthobacter sp.]|uniref:DUF2125 domain-containing protein n=1 Tax=Pseudoxanthobacter sp. TaxID=1925742 RepID=UPI002FE42641